VAGHRQGQSGCGALSGLRTARVGGRGRVLRKLRLQGLLGRSFWLVLAMSGFILSLGPQLRIGSHAIATGPYALLYRFMPGFHNVRYPSAFVCSSCSAWRPLRRSAWRRATTLRRCTRAGPHGCVVRGAPRAPVEPRAAAHWHAGALRLPLARCAGRRACGGRATSLALSHGASRCLAHVFFQRALETHTAGLHRLLPASLRLINGGSRSSPPRKACAFCNTLELTRWFSHRRNRRAYLLTGATFVWPVPGRAYRPPSAGLIWIRAPACRSGS